MKTMGILSIGMIVAAGCDAPRETPAIQAAAVQPGFLLEVEISGMFALVATPERAPTPQVRMLGVRADGSGAHSLPHRAHLQVPCEVLADAAVKASCRNGTDGWEDLDEGLYPQGYALGAGFDLRVEADGPATGVQRSAVLAHYLPDLTRFKAHPSLTGAVDDVVRARTVVRLDLDRGMLGVGQVERREGWTFVTTGPPPAVVDRRDRLAGTLSWLVPAFTGEASIVLAPHAPGEPVRRLRLEAPTGQRHLRVVLSNEPSIAAFCQHEPDESDRVLHHFTGFYALVDNPPAGPDQILPSYDGKLTGCGDPQSWGGNWPRICQKPVLASTFVP